MRRYSFLLATTAAVLISCQREEAEVINPADPAVQTYHFELFEGATKATLGEEGVFWEAGDQVGLYPGSATSVAADVNTDSSPKTVTYSGSPLSVGTSVYSYYPFQSGNTDVSATKFVFPSSQEGGSLSAMPMAGIPFQVRSGDNGTDGVIHFLNLGAVIDFRIFSAKYADERVRAVMFTATSGDHPVSGEATLDLTGVALEDEATLAVSWPANASNPSSVSLYQSCNVAADKAAAAEGHLYMVVAPGTYSGQITIVTNIATYTFPFTDLTLTINTLKRFNMNLESTQATREAWYVKVKSAEEMVDGGKYLIVYENGPFAFKPIRNNDQLESSNNNKYSVTIDNGRIRSTEGVDACQVIFEAANNGYYMKAVAADGYYFYPSSSNITASATPTNACSVTNTSGVVNITAGSNNYFKYSTSKNYFKQSTSNNSRELALYLLDDGSQKTQSLQFSAASITYILDGQIPPVSNITGMPTLSGALTPVTYSSGNTSVATVDAVSGAVTIRGIGETVITATAEENDLFKEGSASYTLKVQAEAVYSLENDQVAAYFDYVEAHPYSPSDYSVSYVETYAKAKNNSSERFDWPKPVPVSWPAPASGSATLIIYKDASHTQQEVMANINYTSSTTADVYSLIPNRDYWYVVRSGDTQIAEGRFHTTGRRRMIKVGDSPDNMSNANNCRDLGGLVTTDGRTVKYNRIFRGSNMDNTTATQKSYLKQNMGIALDVDLRENSNNPLEVTLSGQNYNSFSDLKNVSRMSVTIGDILTAVVNGQNVYVHCKVGADRTGYVCLILEAILGVRQDLCDIDYELTSFFRALDGGDYRKRNDTSRSWYYYPQGITYLTGMTGNTLQEKVVNYVTKAKNQSGLGISAELVQQFQAAMLE